MSRTKRLAWGLVLLAAFLGLCALSFRCAAEIRRIYLSVSLRYDSPIDAKAALAARQHAAANPEDATFWPTFWQQETAEITAEQRNTTAQCLFFDGDASTVWQADFLSGGYPGELDSAGCAISDTLAWQLYGGKDVTGLPLSIGGREYIIRGVFKDSRALALVSLAGSAPGTGWQNVELVGKTDDPKADATTFANASGLGDPTTVLHGSALAFVASAAAYLPLFVAVLLCIISVIRRQHGGSAKSWLIFWGCAIVAALLLPQMLSLIPARFIPGQWSDFSHWGSLWSQLTRAIENWFMLHPALKDAAVKWLLLKQGLALAAALGLLLPIWQILVNRHDLRPT